MLTHNVSVNEVKDLYLAYCGNSMESTLLYTTHQKRMGAVKFVNLWAINLDLIQLIFLMRVKTNSLFTNTDDASKYSATF